MFGNLVCSIPIATKSQSGSDTENDIRGFKRRHNIILLQHYCTAVHPSSLWTQATEKCAKFASFQGFFRIFIDSSFITKASPCSSCVIVGVAVSATSSWCWLKLLSKFLLSNSFASSWIFRILMEVITNSIQAFGSMANGSSMASTTIRA